MRALQIIGLILLCLFLLSRIRIGGWVEYSQSGVLLKVKVGPALVQVFPLKPKKRKTSGQAKPKKEKPPKPEGPKPGGKLELVKELLPVVADAAGQLRRKIRLEQFCMDLLWSSPDPAACAMGFGAANAAVGMIWPLIEQNFNVKQHRIRTAVDFERGSPTVYLLACATLTVGQGIALSLRVGLGIWKAYRRARSGVKKEETNTEQKEAV